MAPFPIGSRLGDLLQTTDEHSASQRGRVAIQKVGLSLQPGGGGRWHLELNRDHPLATGPEFSKICGGRHVSFFGSLKKITQPQQIAAICGFPAA